MCLPTLSDYSLLIMIRSKRERVTFDILQLSSDNMWTNNATGIEEAMQNGQCKQQEKSTTISAQMSVLKEIWCAWSKWYWNFSHTNWAHVQVHTEPRIYNLQWLTWIRLRNMHKSLLWQLMDVAMHGKAPGMHPNGTSVPNGTSILINRGWINKKSH